MFKKGECANPRGRPKGSASRATMRGISEQLSRMEAMQIELIQSVASGDVPPFATVEQALGAIDFLAAGVRDGKFEEATAAEHIRQLRAFVEVHATRNFLSFASGRRFL
jgi:hypothetical protein